MKCLLFFLPLFIISCGKNNHRLDEYVMKKENVIYTIEGSKFFKNIDDGDTLKIINSVHYCECGPFTETYEIFHTTPSKELNCRYRMEKGWGDWIEGIAMVIEFGFSDRVVKSYLKFENDVINKKTGKDDDSCTFYEYFDIILNNDTISSAHSDCSYEGFEEFRDALKENIIAVQALKHDFFAPPFY